AQHKFCRVDVLIKIEKFATIAQHKNQQESIMNLPILRKPLAASLIAATMLFALPQQTALAQSKRAVAPAALQLRSLYDTDPAFKQRVDDMFANLAPTVDGKPNPWLGKNAQDLAQFVDQWHYFLPMTHDGLSYIRKFQALYANNPAGLRFIRQEPGLSWIANMVRSRGEYMDSPGSLALVEQWKAAPRIGFDDYIEPEGGYRSFNDFFTRSLKPGKRPVDRPADDSVIVSPADCIVQIMDVALTDQSALPTKGSEQLNVAQMLNNSPLAKSFVGGTALRCILEPTSYHHYHAPVGGMVLEANQDVAGPYFEERIVPSAARHRRGYLIIETPKYGKVAMVAIGLATISSVKFENRFAKVSQPTPISKGERIGHFAYGGSMVYLLLEKNRLPSLSARQGQQIGVFNEVADAVKPVPDKQAGK
ncbi:MAG: hypothetical protein RL748_1274, partial [Pseudomonadota bacterium]